MDKNMEEKIIAVANYIVDNNATIIQTAEHFNMSPSSIKKYINSKDKLQSIDIELFKKVKEAQMGITLDGQIKGGKTGSTKGNTYLGKEKVLCLITNSMRMMSPSVILSRPEGEPMSATYTWQPLTVPLLNTRHTGIGERSSSTSSSVLER